MLAHADCAHITYAIEQAADLQAQDIRVHAGGADFTIAGTFGRMELQLKITGIFNVYNVMSAVGAALAEHIDPACIQRTLQAFQSVPGRFELVDAGQDFSVIVDYAHTPDGLENILHTARQIAKKRIITVFGCGGDRDRTKRPIMGRIAAELSDVVIATSDNPRTEDPEFILSEVEAGGPALRRTRLDLSTLVTDLAESFAASAEDVGDPRRAAGARARPAGRSASRCGRERAGCRSRSRAALRRA